MIVLELPKWIEIQRKLTQSSDKIKFKIQTFEQKMMEHTFHEYIATMVCLGFDNPEDEVMFRLKWID